MPHPKLAEHSGKFKIALIAFVALVSIFAVSRAMAAVSYSVDTPLTLSGSGISLTITAGSSARSIKTAPASFTVKLTESDHFAVLYPGPEPGRFQNDAGLPECYLTAEGNLFSISGSNAEVTVTPVAEPCPASDSSVIPPPPSISSGGNYVTVTFPNGGEIFEVGSARTILWQSSGSLVKKINLLLSRDGGATFSVVVADRIPDSGSYDWTVPDSFVSDSARFMVEGTSADGRVVASDASDYPFEIRLTSTAEGAETVTEAPAEESPQSAAESAAGSGAGTASLTGSEDSLTEISGQDGTGDAAEVVGETPHPNCPSMLIKAHGAKAVYYCASNGRRYVFPNQQIFFSWFQDFSGIQEIDEQEMSGIALGGNVTYRPDSRLVKVVTDPKVYSVATGRVLRWIKDEIAAVKHFGSDWGKKVDDLPESLFSDYKEGETLE